MSETKGKRKMYACWKDNGVSECYMRSRKGENDEAFRAAEANVNEIWERE